MIRYDAKNIAYTYMISSPLLLRMCAKNQLPEKKNINQNPDSNLFNPSSL